MASRIAIVSLLTVVSSLAFAPSTLRLLPHVCGSSKVSNISALYAKRPYLERGGGRGSSGRGVGGRRTDTVINTPLGTVTLSVTNVLIFLNIVSFILQKRVHNFTNHFIKHDGMVRRGETYRLATSIFLHGSIMHLGANMYSLAGIGRSSENLFGRRRMILFYIMSGVLANVITLILSKAPRSLGASSSIFGLVGCFAVFYFRNRVILGPQATQALNGIKQTVLFNLMYGFAIPEVDIWGHAAGFLSGSFLGLLFGPKLRISKSTRRVVDRPMIDINTLFGGFFNTDSSPSNSGSSAGSSSGEDGEDDVFDITNSRNRRKIR